MEVIFENYSRASCTAILLVLEGYPVQLKEYISGDGIGGSYKAWSVTYSINDMEESENAETHSTAAKR